jgi:hypothetical protein
VVERFLQAMREAGRSDIRKLPVAVVVSKVDAIDAGDVDAGDGIAPGDQGEKVSGWLEAHGGGNLVRLLAAEFGSCRFFAVSSLGRTPDPSNSSAFSPNGTLEPFFWLLSANKIAMNGNATETAATVTDELSARDRAERVMPWPHTPLLAPRPRSAGGYAAGVVVALAIFAGAVALAVGQSNTNTGEAFANTGSTGTGTSGNTGTGSTGNTGSNTGNTGNTGGTGTGNTGSNTGSTGNTGNTGTGNTGKTGLPNHCSRGVDATQSISCGLASNVFYEYYKATQAGGTATTLSAWSPATKKYYDVSCSSGAAVVTCTISGATDPNAEVDLTQSALSAYSPQLASTYTANADVGPNG